MSQSGVIMEFVHRRRRGAELFLLVLALAVGVGAYAAVGLGVEGEVPTDIIGYGGWLASLVVVSHVVVRFVAPYADPVLLPVVAALNGLGLAVIHRLDLADGTTFARQQLTWMTLGVALFVLTLVMLRDHRLLQRFTYTSGLAAIVLLLLPMVPGLGTTINSARIWIHVGPFSFQPGEVAKLLLVVTFAGYLVLHRDALALAGRRVLFVDLPRGRDLGPILLMWLVSLGVLVFQRDLGSSLLFFGLFLIMLYVATERAGWLIVGSVLFFGGALLAYRLFPHVQVRVDTWLHPFDYYDDSQGATSFQLVESMFGMGWGGLLGRGFGDGMPDRIPRAESDFIMGALGEELGLTGVIAVILMYGLIVERALRASLICRDNFGKLVAVGLAGVVALQVFVVIGGVTRLIPLTGLTTPFLSYGGSSLVANWVLVALLLRISDHARRPAPSLATEDDADQEATQVVKMSLGDEAALWNKPIRTISIFCMLLFLALMANATYLQYWQADALNEDARNRRIIQEAFSRERGAILLNDRVAVAESVASDDEYEFQRTYPQPFRYAPVTGWFSYYSQTGIEQSQNDVLSGDDSRLFVTRLVDLVNGNSTEGGQVSLTIDPDAQTAAFEGLRALGPDVQGAVVAIEPTTGKILANVSLPTYDPNLLASHDFASVSESYDRLNEDPTKPLLNRGIQTTLPPGSTFKLVTAAAAIESGNWDASSTVPAGATYQLPETRGDTGLVDNEGRTQCSPKRISFELAMEWSCNTTFAQLAIEVGAEAMYNQAEAFGFNTHYLDDLAPQAESVYPAGTNKPQTGQTGFGQFDVRATPLQMAMVAGGIANGGIVMKPYIVDEVQSADLDILDKTSPTELSQAVSATTANELTKLMVATVNEGTADDARIDGVEVAGKTGTAQSGVEGKPPYAWFVSFAPADDPQVAVAVMIESVPGKDTSEIAGGALGGPIARAVMEAVIR